VKRSLAAVLVLAAALSVLGSALAGGGGVQADLVLTKTVSKPKAETGDLLTYTIEVKVKLDGQNTKTATKVIVTDTLPAGTVLVSTYSDRGSGCSGTTTLTCNLDYLYGTVVGRITIVVRVTQAGEIVNTATVTQNGTDPVPADNTASARTTVIQPTPPAPPGPTANHPGPPRLVASGSRPVQATRYNGVREVKFRLFVGEPASVSAQLVGANGRARLLRSGSRLGSTRLSEDAVKVETTVTSAGVLRVRLLVPDRPASRGQMLDAVIQATDPTGELATLRVPVRL
jgi:uncharacterized repeat protein (TIGR01451 family)